MPGSFTIALEIGMQPKPAFDRTIEELTSALEQHHIQFGTGQDAHVAERGFRVGEILTYEPGRRAVFRWRSASWTPEDGAELQLAVEPTPEGSRVTLEYRGVERLASTAEEVLGWFTGEILANAVRATAPVRYGDWFTDRYARRPSGAQSRATYADPLYHYPNFRAILRELALAPADHLIEVGCGGGAFLNAALKSGCRAAAVDHSGEMLRVARQTNARAVSDGRLVILEARADALPFADRVFTRAAMTGVLGFLPDPVAAFAEIRRVLRPQGVFVGLGSDPELRGTPAAPEPMASRLTFYGTGELEQLGRAAGFSEVRVIRCDLEPFAREAGVPEEHLPLFAAKPGEGARFLVCRR